MKRAKFVRKLLYFTALSLCAAMIVLFVKSEPREAVFALFLAVFLHETGHILALFMAGESIKGVLFLPMGVLLSARFSCSYLCEALIYLAGPAVSIVFGLAAFFFARGGGGATLFWMYFSVISLGLGAFNLCPLPALDGSCALSAILLNFCEDMRGAWRVLRVLEGVLSALFFLSFGGVWLVTGELSYPMLMGVFFIIRFACG